MLDSSAEQSDVTDRRLCLEPEVPTGILANHQLDRKQVTPTAILRVLISEVGCDLHPIIVMTTKYVMICSSPHIRRIISNSLNVYKCSRRFTHSFVNEIKRHGSRKEYARDCTVGF